MIQPAQNMVTGVESAKNAEDFLLPEKLALLAVAEGKGVSLKALASLSSCALGNIEKYFSGRDDAILESAKKNIAGILGFNNRGMLNSSVVHFINIDEISGNRADRLRKLKAIGGCIGHSMAAIIDIPFLVNDLRSFFVVQNVDRNIAEGAESHDVRVLFCGGLKLLLSLRSAAWHDGPEFIPQCKWARGSAKNTHVKIKRSDNISHVRNMDMTPIEFDGLFFEERSATWNDADLLARKAGISTEEVIHWIETVSKNRSHGEDVPVELRVIKNGGIDEISNTSTPSRRANKI